ncbi:MAG: tyrosine decarboxylase MfnA [Candidatus Lokiarchaeota archaeon]|nr:tyrosine decarboxylase MfnA [Candidatus Lokiarchaeota archaeon]
MLNEQGLSEEQVLSRLNSLLENDATYRSGHPVASMSTIPHSIGSEVFYKTMEKNAGRLHTFKGSAQVECEVIAMIGELLNLENPVGSTTSGGTESNILAMLCARESNKKIQEPEIIAPRTVHSSVDKAAWLLGIKLVKTPIDKEFKAKPKAIQKKINENTIGIFTTAGTTYLGQIDPIDKIGKIAQDNRLHLHVDAAFGGFVIPFLRDLGISHHQFAFEVEGVTSVSSDPHKMGLAPIPAGSLIFRSKKFLKKITKKIPYLQGASATQSTILGTRPAGAILATWAVMKRLGKEGYRQMVLQCIENTQIALNRLEDNPLLKPAIKPVMNIIGIKSNELPLEYIVENMEKRGWRMATSPKPHTMRLVLMPHVTVGALNAFFNDLDQVSTTIPAD